MKKDIIKSYNSYRNYKVNAVIKRVVFLKTHREYGKAEIHAVIEV